MAKYRSAHQNERHFLDFLFPRRLILLGMNAFLVQSVRFWCVFFARFFYFIKLMRFFAQPSCSLRDAVIMDMHQVPDRRLFASLLWFMINNNGTDCFFAPSFLRAIIIGDVPLRSRHYYYISFQFIIALGAFLSALILFSIYHLCIYFFVSDFIVFAIKFDESRSILIFFCFLSKHFFSLVLFVLCVWYYMTRLVWFAVPSVRRPTYAPQIHRRYSLSNESAPLSWTGREVVDVIILDLTLVKYVLRQTAGFDHFSKSH